MSNRIYYAVIALTAEEATDLVSSLYNDGFYNLSKWLADKKDSIYGNLPKDWRPFEDKTISDIIEEETDEYKCETHLISTINEDCTNADILSDIDVFFIDVFAMYIKKYENLAKTVDYNFMNALEGKCCLVMNYTLPVNLQVELENKYCNTWNYVLKGYENGSLHRVAARVKDLNNFKNFLIKHELNEHPSPGAERGMRNNPETSKITSYEKSMPSL